MNAIELLFFISIVGCSFLIARLVAPRISLNIWYTFAIILILVFGILTMLAWRNDYRTNKEMKNRDNDGAPK